MSPIPRSRALARSISPIVALLACVACHDVGAETAQRKQRAGAAAAFIGSPGDRLVAHEWGTFISVQGSDGVSLEGVQNEVETLPSFVYSATRARASVFSDFGDASHTVPVRRVRGKGETPVIYFYSKRRRRVRVRVDFPRGLLAQWYPQADQRPSMRATFRQPLDLARVRNTSLRWDLELIPPDLASREGVTVNAVPDDHLWAIARVPQAATVRTVNRFGGKRQAERYVFYRGLGRIALPVSVRPLGTQHAQLQNNTRYGVPRAFVLEMGERDGRFVAAGAIGAGKRKIITLPTARQPKAAVVAALGAAMQRALVVEGLYPAEASAMVRTWSKAWFASRGRRVLTIIPRRENDRIWPLAISPRPDELVRVLVGRLEYFTSEDEASISAALRSRLSPDRSARAAAIKQLARWGRFLEPALRGALKKSRDPRVRLSAKQMLARYR